MKRILSILLVLSLMLCQLIPVLAEDGDDDLEIEEIVENVDLDDAEKPPLSDEDLAELEKIGQSLDSFEFEPYNVNTGSLEMNPNLPGNVTNILLIGLDSRAEDLQDNADKNSVKHADVQIILSLNPDDQVNPIKLTSFLRDTLVEIPTSNGYMKSKITNSYGYYENRIFHDFPDRTLQTINHNFEMNVQYYVAINFYGVVAIIDSMGGIDVDLNEGEAYHINAYIKKYAGKMLNTYDTKERRAARQELKVAAGVQHLDGLQALMYARIRSSLKKKYDSDINGDWGRTARTRHLLDLLMQKALDKSSGISLFDLFSECLDYVSTNITPSVIWDLMTKVLQSGIASRLGQENATLISQFRIPMDKNRSGKKPWSYETVNGDSVVFMSSKNFQESVEMLHEFIYGRYYPAK
ncbi:MAG: LytR family transcriptional regulator [Clostridiales bacterium]|nr:LytR family transcriptional regulator [Clostridiales bacterium]